MATKTTNGGTASNRSYPHPQGFPEHAVTLHYKEFVMATHAGMMRQVENLTKGLRHKHAANDAEAWAMHIDGCIGEVIAAKWLDVYWSPGRLRESDLKRCGIEVRASRHYQPHLPLHDDDHDDKPYVLVWLSGLAGYVCGWIVGRDGKDRERYWTTEIRGKPLRSPAYFVPMEKLRPATELRRMVQKKLGER